MRIRAFQYLGGKCVDCGSVEKLEFDHIDPETVSFRIGARLFNWKVLVRELDKCQLLCQKCHKVKTLIDLDHHSAPMGYSKYTQGCRCIECKEANTLYHKAYRKRHDN